MRRVFCIADNIISPLGWSSEENYAAVLRGESGVSRHTDELAEPYMAALTDRDKVRAEAAGCGIDTDQFTYFETLCLLSVSKALERCRVVPKRTQLILSTTKGNISLALDNPSGFPSDRMRLGVSEKMISEHFGFGLPPIVISNACISGVCAEIEGLRRIRAGICDYAVVVGCDEQSRFIVSGFQSFKALSPEPCRPFDADRKGLNLGEAAATVVLTAGETLKDCPGKRWEIIDGAIRNDANHISGPSRTGEGSYRALKYVLESPLWEIEDIRERLAVINAHGTATAYNDEMESIAIDRAGLSKVPVNSLKGFFGHTMGAAGVLETILSMRATADGVLLPTKGFANCGVSRPLDVSPEIRRTDKESFIKLISGFGGCNAAIGFKLTDSKFNASALGFGGLDDSDEENMSDESTSTIAKASLDSNEDLEAAYRQLGITYPKFFKMDRLCKSGLIASERLIANALKSEGDADEFGDKCAIVLANRSSSLCNDLHYIGTIQEKDSYFPSPSLFVYTLPNIVTGEIAIRNKIYGESIFYVDEQRSDKQMEEEALLTMQDRETEYVICGWTECTPDGECTAELRLLKRGRNMKKWLYLCVCTTMNA